MEAHNPQYFYPPPQSYPSVRYTQNPANNHQSEFQVQRWANWVKFVAYFIIISSGINLVKLVFQFMFNDQPDIVSNDSLIQLMFLELLYIGVGCLGCKVSNQKTSVSAKNFVVTLMLLILVSSVIIVSVIYDIVLNACRENEKQDSENLCDSDTILSIALIAGGIMFVTLTCMCLPFILCICKLRKSAEELEGSRRLAPVGQDIQMMNYFPNSSVNLEHSRN